MSFLTKYNNSAAQIFKIRMQLKAEINDLRKTYQEVVIQKSQPKRKYFGDKLNSKTNLLPEHNRSLNKTPQKRHFSPSPTLKIQEKEKIQLPCKRQFKNIKNTDSLNKALRHQTPFRKKSLSPVLNSRHNISMMQFPSHNESTDGLKIGLADRSVSKQNRPSKRIIPKYHQYNYSLLLG